MIDESIYLDEYFHNYQDVKIETQEEIFALDDHMRLMVKEKLMTERGILRISYFLFK